MAKAYQALGPFNISVVFSKFAGSAGLEWSSLIKSRGDGNGVAVPPGAKTKFPDPMAFMRSRRAHGCKDEA